MSKAINSLIALACGDAYGNAYEMDGLIGKTFDKALLPKEAKIKNVGGLPKFQQYEI